MWPLSILSEMTIWERIASIAGALASCIVAVRKIGGGKPISRRILRYAVAQIRTPFLEYQNENCRQFLESERVDNQRFREDFLRCQEDVADLRRAIEEIRANRAGGSGSSSGSSAKPETTPTPSDHG